MMNWKVIGTICPSKFEETKESVIAEFETLVNAEDFISLVLPKETRDRFRIEHIQPKRSDLERQPWDGLHGSDDGRPHDKKERTKS